MPKRQDMELELELELELERELELPLLQMANKERAKSKYSTHTHTHKHTLRTTRAICGAFLASNQLSWSNKKQIQTHTHTTHEFCQ